MADNRKIWLYCSSLSFSQAHYILRKVVGSAVARELLLDIADIVTIVAVDSRNVNDALRSSLTDFEDALQYHAVIAENPAIEAIVTRDPKGFAAGALPVLTPPAALAAVLG
ncbi:PIN domain-containing protein [Hymenobacter caeli]|uniref:PIN domain-containing protein n=1 Tax=Hymenobacter caeli TaxID=2735894 RepID=UPI003625BE43